MKTTIVKTMIFVMFSIGIGLAQQKKIKLTPENYSKWGELDYEIISSDAKWVSYNLKYDEAPDTLFVQHISSSMTYSFPSATDGKFSNDGKWFTASDPQKGLTLLSLTGRNVKWHPDVLQHEFYLPNKFLVMLCKSSSGSQLEIWDYHNNKKYTYPEVTEFKISATGNILILNPEKIRIIFNREDFKEFTITKDSKGVYKNAVWNDQGNKLAFLQEMPSDKYKLLHKLFCYDTSLSKLYTLESTQSSILKGENILPPMMITPIFFSPEGDRVFFSRGVPQPKESKKDTVEIWDTAAPLDYIQQINEGNVAYQEKLTEWIPKTNNVTIIASDEFPSVLITPDRKKALNYNRLLYEPQFEFYAPVDIYITDLNRGERKLVLQKQQISRSTIMASPLSNYISYFRDKHWWIYDIRQNCHTNVTEGLRGDFSGIDAFSGGQLEAYGSPGWSTNDKYLFIYDKFDIWIIDSESKTALKITNGMEMQTQYRIAESFVKNYTKYASVNFGKPGFDFSNSIALHAIKSDMSGGYYLWKLGEDLQKIEVSGIGISRLQRAGGSDFYIYVEQSATTPPQLVLTKTKMQQKKILFKSNDHFKKYRSGTAELITYDTVDEKGLKGILYYPPAFDSNKKYPMIVYIYERLSGDYHLYLNPSMYRGHGFNPVNYSLDGYLVLLPDIKYQVGKPGESALKCVSSAIEVVKAKGIVETNHIGLIGHSFGGFEVTYIITQTTMFAAAVAGAPITDLVSNYFSMHWDTAHSNMWRFETQQYRMGKSAFEDYSNFINNSPIAQASGISTPLLMWSGKNDENVSWNQSMELQMALRRLQKRSVLLVYDKEGHVIDNPDNQKDLSIRIKDWFNEFLK